MAYFYSTTNSDIEGSRNFRLKILVSATRHKYNPICTFATPLFLFHLCSRVDQFPQNKRMSESEKRTTVVDFERLKAQYQLPQSTSTKDQPTQPDGPSHSPSGLPSKGPKKRNASPLKEPSRKVVKGPPKALGLFQALQSGGGSKTLIVRDESPWDTFELSFSCKLAGTVVIAAHRSRPSRVIAIRQYSAGDVETMLQRFSRIQHENIMCSSECYRHNCSLYAVVDDLPLTLEHLGSRAVCPNEIQLGSIMRQVS